MKGGAPHELPLAPDALQLIKTLPRPDGARFLFSFNGGHSSVGGFARVKARLDEASGIKGWVLHDIRRSVRSQFSALAGHEDHVREAVLDHRVSGIKRVYDLHLYRDEKRALLTAWEARLRGIVEPERKIVSLARG
jgi:integrase